jgi:hypothetical protein
MLGQTFVCPDNALHIKHLCVYSGRGSGPENPSESLVESGLSHPAGKTFRTEEEAGSEPGADYVCDQSAARASAGGIDRNSTPTR